MTVPAVVGIRSAPVELPDFHIPHAEKIEFMIETDGFAIEPVPPDLSSDPPRAGYTYTIGFPADVAFPELVVFGIKPVNARGLIGLVRDQLRGGAEIPLGVELVGLLDNELRCRFAPVDLAEWGAAVRHRRRLVPRRAVRGRAARVPRPQRLPALRGRLRRSGRPRRRPSR